MAYNQPFKSLTNSEKILVKSDKNVKEAYIDALTYMHDGLCQFASHPRQATYPYFKHVDVSVELYKCMQIVGQASIRPAGNIEDNTRTMEDLQSELSKNPNSSVLITLVDTFLEELVNEFNQLRS